MAVRLVDAVTYHSNEPDAVKQNLTLHAEKAAEQDAEQNAE